MMSRVCNKLTFNVHMQWSANELKDFSPELWNSREKIDANLVKNSLKSGL